MFKLGGIAKGSWELDFLDHPQIEWMFELGSTARGSGEVTPYARTHFRWVCFVKFLTKEFGMDTFILESFLE